MKRSRFRPWYAGRTFPTDEVVAVFDQDPAPAVLYDQTDAASIEGDYANTMRGLYGKMDSLKRSPDDFRTWADEDGYLTFYNALVDFAESEIRMRVQILQRLGAFKFRSNAGPDEKKSLIEACFAEPTEQEDARIVPSTRARRLSQIWSPVPDSLLDYIVARPAQVGRVLSDRLNPTNTEPLKLIGHPFTGVRSTTLQPIADARVLAFERDGEIHIIPGVGKTLTNWDADTAAVGGVEQVSLLETLLLHELVELVAHEQNAELPPLCTHLVAISFERYLKADLLSVAVEDFFLDWPQLSEDEEAEHYEMQLKQELEEANAMFAEEDIPDDFGEEDEDDLPIDSDGKAPKKKILKKKIVKKIVKKVPGTKSTGTKMTKKSTAKVAAKKIVKKKKE